MPPPITLPVALTIAGSDSGAGAGLQADLKTFAALGVHGVTAVTCLTAQNPREVRAVRAVSPAFLETQLATLSAGLPPAAAKTGMLYSAGLIRTVARWWSGQDRCPLVVDPVMVSTSGARLLTAPAVRAIQDELLPQCTLVTPNLDEAVILTGRPLVNLDDLRWAARWIWSQFGCAALVKGGHLRRLPRALDVFFDGRDEWLLEADFVRGVQTHGTGCTYSAAITAFLARGLPLFRAVSEAKAYVTGAISGSVRIGRHMALGWTSAMPGKARVRTSVTRLREAAPRSGGRKPRPGRPG